MMPRSSEAVRLEADYLARLRTALAGRPAPEVAEIVQNVEGHIEDALAEFGSGEITLVQMAGVIERLGPPEAYARESAVQRPEIAHPFAAATTAAPVGPTSEAKAQFAELLDKMWWAYLVGMIGLFVPVINLQFCEIASAIMLAVMVSKAILGKPAEFRGVSALMGVNAVLLLLYVPSSILELVHPAFGIISLPIVIGFTVCCLIAYWKVMTGTASFVRGAGHQDIATSILSARNIYIVLFFGLVVVGLCAGGVAVFAFNVKNAVQLWWVGLLLLPLNWLIGWLFVLRPLGQARDALRQGAGAAHATA